MTGPLTSSTRGGFGFRNTSASFNRAPLQTGRAYQAPGRNFGSPQRFAVETNPNGGTDLVLSENEEVTVGTNSDGEVVINVSDKDEESTLGRRSGGFGQRNKMSTAVSDDGVLVLRPNEGSTLHIVGDATSGSVSIVELPSETELPELPETSEPVITPV